MEIKSNLTRKELSGFIKLIQRISFEFSEESENSEEIIKELDYYLSKKTSEISNELNNGGLTQDSNLGGGIVDIELDNIINSGK